MGARGKLLVFLCGPVLLLFIIVAGELSRQTTAFNSARQTMEVKVFLQDLSTFVRLLRQEKILTIKYIESAGNAQAGAKLQAQIDRVQAFREQFRSDYTDLVKRDAFARIQSSVSRAISAARSLPDLRQRVTYDYSTVYFFEAYNEVIDKMLLVFEEFAASILYSDFHLGALVWSNALQYEELSSRESVFIQHFEAPWWHGRRHVIEWVLLADEIEYLRQTLGSVVISAVPQLMLDEALEYKKLPQYTGWKNATLYNVKHQDAYRLEITASLLTSLAEREGAIASFNDAYGRFLVEKSDRVFSFSLLKIITLGVALIMVLSLTAWLGWLIVKSISERLKALTKALQAWEVSSREIASVDIGGTDEIGQIAGTVNQMMIHLADYRNRLERNSDALIDMNNKLLHEQSERMKEENVAKEVFSRIVKTTDHVEGVCCWGQSFSAFSGDLVLTAQDSRGVIHCLLCDFTGHGLPAALGAVPVSAIFRAMVRRDMYGDEVLAELNEKLKELLPTDYFACAAYMKIDFQGNNIKVWNCGMPPVVVVNHKGEVVYTCESQNLPLGITFLKSFEKNEYSVQAGDSLYAYSDGITEARNHAEEMFGQARFKALVMEEDVGTGRIEKISHALTDFIGDAALADDMSIVEIRFPDQ